MVLRAIIIDDEQKGIDALRILINRFLPDLKVIAESASATEGIYFIENYKPDIVFLDINMPELNGFELLEALTWKSFNLIFTTAHQEYALKALKNNAVDYLLKPIDHIDLLAAVKRATQNTLLSESNKSFNYSELLVTVKNTPKNKINIQSKSGIESIDLSEIICLESMSNYTKIYHGNLKEILTIRSLKEFENELCKSDQKFMRVHNSYIINLHKIARYVKNSEAIIMLDERKVPLAKSKKDVFLKWLNL